MKNTLNTLKALVSTFVTACMEVTDTDSVIFSVHSTVYDLPLSVAIDRSHRFAPYRVAYNGAMEWFNGGELFECVLHAIMGDNVVKDYTAFHSGSDLTIDDIGVNVKSPRAFLYRREQDDSKELAICKYVNRDVSPVYVFGWIDDSTGGIHMYVMTAKAFTRFAWRFVGDDMRFLGVSDRMRAWLKRNSI